MYIMSHYYILYFTGWFLDMEIIFKFRMSMYPYDLP
jgi:hypothetical protein